MATVLEFSPAEELSYQHPRYLLIQTFEHLQHAHLLRRCVVLRHRFALLLLERFDVRLDELQLRPQPLAPLDYRPRQRSILPVPERLEPFTQIPLQCDEDPMPHQQGGQPIAQPRLIALQRAALPMQIPIDLDLLLRHIDSAIGPFLPVLFPDQQPRKLPHVDAIRLRTPRPTLHLE